ncbi:MAG: TMEM175 family protein [Candidatus Micrarchaeaceae archaeon]
MKKESAYYHKIDERIESLTDLIFGLALSIGAVLLASNAITNTSQLISNLFSYGFGFFILVFVWFRYTAIISRIKFSTRSIVFLNLLLLFFVTLEPYLFNIMKSSISMLLLNTVSSLFAFDMGAIMLILAVLTFIVIKQKAISRLNHYIQLVTANVIVAIIFFISMLPYFWNTLIFGLEARFFVWIFCFPLTYLILRISKSR